MGGRGVARVNDEFSKTINFLISAANPAYRADDQHNRALREWHCVPYNA